MSSFHAKEAIAILEALKKWKHYLASSYVIIRTDQQSLKYIHEQRIVDGIQHKLLIKLLGFNYPVEYKNGKEHKVANALSRAGHADLLALSCVVPVWVEQVINSYAEDPKCQDFIAKLSIDKTAVPSTTLQNGILRYKGKIVIGQTGNLKSELLDSFHKSALGGHSGERATYKRLNSIFYWPNMHHQVKDYVKACPFCQKNKSEHNPYPSLLEQLPVPEMARTHISMDFVEFAQI